MSTQQTEIESPRTTKNIHNPSHSIKSHKKHPKREAGVFGIFKKTLRNQNQGLRLSIGRKARQGLKIQKNQTNQ